MYETGSFLFLHFFSSQLGPVDDLICLLSFYKCECCSLALLQRCAPIVSRHSRTVTSTGNGGTHLEPPASDSEEKQKLAAHLTDTGFSESLLDPFLSMRRNPLLGSCRHSSCWTSTTRSLLHSARSNEVPPRGNRDTMLTQKVRSRRHRVCGPVPHVAARTNPGRIQLQVERFILQELQSSGSCKATTHLSDGTALSEEEVVAFRSAIHKCSCGHVCSSIGHRPPCKL